MLTEMDAHAVFFPQDVMARDFPAAGIRHGVVEAGEQGGPKLHQMAPFPQEISHGTLLPRVDVAFFEDPEGEELGQPEGVMFVIDVLESLVLLSGAGIGQMNRIALLHEGIDEPVPVKRGLDHHSCQLCLVGGKEGQNELPIVRDIVLEDPLSPLVNDRQVTILCMKIDSTVQFHRAPPD
jgi:hypothetical protein